MHKMFHETESHAKFVRTLLALQKWESPDFKFCIGLENQEKDTMDANLV